jgi:hypothetical protein
MLGVDYCDGVGDGEVYALVESTNLRERPGAGSVISDIVRYLLAPRGRRFRLVW